MSAEQSELFDNVSLCRQRGYYWRLIARECEEPAKLRGCVSMLAEEIDAHAIEAQKLHLCAPENSNGHDMATWLLEGSNQSLSMAIDALVSDLEAWRAMFRQHDHWPPQKFEAQDVARAFLGYDPNRAADILEDEL